MSVKDEDDEKESEGSDTDDTEAPKNTRVRDLESGDGTYYKREHWW